MGFENGVDCGRGTSRRGLFQGALGIGAGLILDRMRPAFGQSGSTSAQPIATRPIPHSGELLPVIGLGTANDFQVTPEGEARANLKKVVDDLLAQGCKLIDTASSYGAAESVLGDLLSDQDRTKVFLATKIEDGSKSGGSAEFHHSLERLRTPQVDLLQLHNVQNPRQDLAPFRDWKAQGSAAISGSRRRSRATMARRKR